MVDLLKGLKCDYTKKIDSTSEKKHSDIDSFLVLFFLSHMAGVGLFCFVFPGGFCLALTKLKCTNLFEGFFKSVSSNPSQARCNGS